MSAEVEMFNAPSKTQPSTRSQRRGESVLQNRSVAAQGGGASALLVGGSREWPMRIDGRDRQVQRSRRAIRQPALAFLAPEMVERVVAGRQPPELTPQALRTGRFDIPVDWMTQKRALGFAQPA
jgi:hypothetical protein